MKLLIYIKGKPLLRGYRQREFLWNEARGVYLFEGKELAPSEFNEAYARAEKRNYDLNPQVMVVEEHAGELKAELPVPASVAPVATVAAGREITLEEAEAVMWRLAPERMKKKAPKAAEMNVA